MSGILFRPIVLIITIGLLFTSVPIMIEQGFGRDRENETPARVDVVDDMDGGEWFDDLADASGTDRMACLEKDPQGYRIGQQHEKILFLEDFESYSNGQNLFGVNGWMKDDNRHLSASNSQFTATTSGMSPMPSNTIGKIYNPDDEYSWTLSDSFSIDAGILSCWIATDAIKNDYGATAIHLMNTQSPTPETGNRAAGISISDHGIRYRDSDSLYHVLVDRQDISEDTWYRFEIRFDCVSGLVSYFVFDEDGFLLGSVSDVDFMTPASTMGRIELFTMRDYYTYWFTSFWDEIKIIPPPGEEMKAGQSVVEDFQSYSDGQDLFGVNGWTEDTSRPLVSDNHRFTATSQAPSPMPSTRVGKIYNPDDKYSFILSPRTDLSTGVIRCWFLTDTVIEDDSSGGISLMRSQTGSPTHSGRVAGMKVVGSDLTYITATHGQPNQVFMSNVIEANQWYRFEIRFNCSSGEVSFYVHDQGGDLVGAAIDTPMVQQTDTIGRLELFTDRDEYTVYYSCYWDDFEIYGLTSEYSMVSDEIELPSGCRWTSFGSESITGAGNSIQIEILDDNEESISGFIYDGSSSSIDLDSLNSLDVESIRLKAVLSGTYGNSPVMVAWGVEWRHLFSWRDSFISSVQVGTFSDTEVSMGELVLSAGKASGSMETEVISLPENNRWTEVRADIDLGTGSYLTLDILDAGTGNVIPGMSDLTGSGMTAWNVSNMGKQEVRIRVSLAEGGTSPPALRSLSISWTPNRAPIIESLTVVSSVYRMDSVKIQVAASDPDDPLESLDVNVRSRSGPLESWNDLYLTDPVYNMTTDLWECIFSPDADSSPGNHSFRVSAADPHGRNAVRIFFNSTMVMNKIPSPPVISLEPENPRVFSDISAIIEEPGSDPEGQDVLYDYYWSVNGIPVTDEIDTGMRGNQISYLSSEHTAKGDVIRCNARSLDGIDQSPFFTATVTVVNSPVNILPDWDDRVIMEEDTVDDSVNILDSVEDLDGDDVTWTLSDIDVMDISVDEDGQMTIAPEEDYFGTENLTVNLTDGSSFAEGVITIEVVPVNDRPVIDSFTADKLSVMTGEDVEFSASALDVDDEELIFTWSVDGQTVSGDGDRKTINWNLDDWTEEEWMSKKNTKTFTVSVRISDGEYMIGPFSIDVNVTLREMETYNQPPEIIELTATSQQIYVDDYVVISLDVDDPDGDDLLIYWTNSMVPEFNTTGESINVSDLPAGENVFTVTVNDGRHSVNRTISITVSERPDDEESSFPFLILGAIFTVIFVLIIVALVVAFVVVKGKKKDEPEEPGDISSGGTVQGGESLKGGSFTGQGQALGPQQGSEQLPPRQGEAPQLPAHGIQDQAGQQYLPSAGGPTSLQQQAPPQQVDQALPQQQQYQPPPQQSMPIQQQGMQPQQQYQQPPQQSMPMHQQGMQPQQQYQQPPQQSMPIQQQGMQPQQQYQQPPRQSMPMHQQGMQPQQQYQQSPQQQSVQPPQQYQNQSMQQPPQQPQGTPQQSAGTPPQPKPSGQPEVNQYPDAPTPAQQGQNVQSPPRGNPENTENANNG